MLGKEEMGCPPADMATAGRANPMGIPYLYLCKNEETTYYEVRALYHVANLQSSDLAMEVSKYLLLQRISKDLSKLTSMRPRLKELNDTPYIPI